MARDDDAHSSNDERPSENGRLIDDETTVIDVGTHSAASEDPERTGAWAWTGDPAPDQSAPHQPGPDQPAPDQPAPDQPQADPARDQSVTDQPVPDQPLTGPAPGAAFAEGIGPGPQRAAIDPPRTSDGAHRKQIAAPPGPALVAVGLGLLTKDGWVFQDINLTLRQSSVAAIVGPAGTGRTSLLLALIGRMEANTGSLTVAGHSLRDRPKNVRAVTTVARAGRSVSPEPRLTVSESVTERCLIEDEPLQSGRSRFEEACKALHLKFDPKMLVGRIAGEQATLLALALACVRVSAVIALDDLDRDVSAGTQQRMLDALIRLAKAMGPTIIVTTTDRIPVMDADVVLDLTPMDGAAIWALDPGDAPTEVIGRELGGYGASPWVAELGTVDADQDQGPHPHHRADDPNDDADNPTDGPDYDGRWSRERWESPEAGPVTGPNDPGPDDPGPDRAGAAPGADDAPAPTEDPR